MNRSLVLATAVALVSACSASGHYQRSGPCQGWHTDQDACLRAHENSSTITKIQLGQSLAEVRATMGRDPERREASGTIERWGYLTDYANELMTILTFTDGVLTEIKQGPYHE